MFRHVVMFTWKPSATEEQKQRVVTELLALAPRMPGMRSYAAGPDLGLAAGNFDFAVVAELDDAESYAAYRDHRDHRAIIEEFIAPIRQDRASVQFES